VKVEEKEEEDPDVHFKRKRKGGPHRKRVVKKFRRHTPAIVESESAVVAPPSVPRLIFKSVYFIPHLHIYLILNSANNTSLVCCPSHEMKKKTQDHYLIGD